jgi:hypothetical protein
MRTAQLQIRVTPAEKARIELAARRAGLGMSAYVLSKVLPGHRNEWLGLLHELATTDDERLALAAVSSWLASLDTRAIADALESPPPVSLSPYLANTLAAMVEHICAGSGTIPPAWTRDIPPLARPVFGSRLASLRLHLLAGSPAAFRRRNLFVDTTVGGQV